MSPLPFELLLALRYLRPKRTFVSIITLISVLGVTLGVAVLIIVISVMSGFDKQLRDVVFGFNAHMKVLEQGHTMRDFAYVMSTVASNRQVTGVAPIILDKVMMETQPAVGEPQQAAPWLRGVDPKSEGAVSVLPRRMVLGEFDLSGRGLLVGVDLAHSLRLHVGDRVAIFSSKDLKKLRQQKGKTAQTMPDAEDFIVRGIFDAGFYQYNADVVVTSLENAQDLSGLQDDVNGLLVMVRDPNSVRRVAADLQGTLGPRYLVSTWMEENDTMVAVMVEKNVMLYILFFIVIVAAFGITCTLITFVVQKTREIGVLKALGASNRQVLWIFLAQSLSISVLGILFGTAVGLLALAYRNPFLHFMNRLTGFELFPASVYGFSELPALIIPGDIAIICGGSLLICLGAAAFPAWHASRLRPVEALRNE
jgi:lipoprotein-releasing system permease protein